MLGSVLKRGLAIADVLPFLKPHHFYERRHEHIYAAMAALFERAAAIDYHTIAEELDAPGHLRSSRRAAVPVRAELADAVGGAHRALRPHRARARRAAAVHQRRPAGGRAGLEPAQGPGHGQAARRGAGAGRLERHAEPARGAAGRRNGPST